MLVDLNRREAGGLARHWRHLHPVRTVADSIRRGRPRPRLRLTPGRCAPLSRKRQGALNGARGSREEAPHRGNAGLLRGSLGGAVMVRDAHHGSRNINRRLRGTDRLKSAACHVVAGRQGLGAKANRFFRSRRSEAARVGLVSRKTLLRGGHSRHAKAATDGNPSQASGLKRRGIG
jgi:hypothetical protein